VLPYGSRLSDSFRVPLAQLKIELDQLSARIEIDVVMQQTAHENELNTRRARVVVMPALRHGNRFDFDKKIGWI
jgi:hypothetical protein